MSWTHHLVNGWVGDPGLLSVSASGDVVLCDGGSLENLSDKQLSRVHTFCVTHHHMDHSQGLQKWLRVRARREKENPWVRLVGPIGTLEMLLSHLRSYTWNLLDEDWFSFDVYECGANQDVTRSFVRFSSGVYLDFQEQQSALPTGLQCVVLDHNIDVLAYRLDLQDTFSYQETKGLEAGPWLSLLKQKVLEKDWDVCIPSPKGSLSVRELSDECLVTRKSSFAYLTDFVFSKENIHQIKKLAGSVSHVFCEASFPENERQRAFRVKHLTSYQSALVAHLLGADEFSPFHVSSAFEEKETYQEAQEFFRILGQRQESLRVLVFQELEKVEKSTPV